MVAVSPDAPEISVVVPAFNEQETLEVLFDAVATSVSSAAESWELVIVDDGSRDRTRAIIDDLSARDARVRGVILSRNFGHEAAIEAGLRTARGQAVIVMDADMQDSPDALPRLIEAWRDGADVAYAVREGRKEGALMRAAFSGFYRFASKTMSIDLPRDAGPFCLMSRRAVDALNDMREHGRYFPGLRAFVGFTQVGVPIERRERYAGETKYPLAKRTGLAIAAIFSFSKLPLRIATIVGIASAVIAVLLAIYFLVATLAGVDVERGWTSLMVVLLFIGGLQLMVLGIVGEYVGKVYDETRNRPTFIVAEQIGGDSPSDG